MAKIILWENLKEGMNVWEDAEWGTETIKADVVKRFGDEFHVSVIRFRYDLPKGPSLLDSRRSREYRYWDSKPTLEERETTPWR